MKNKEGSPIMQMTRIAAPSLFQSVNLVDSGEQATVCPCPCPLALKAD
jgi:hypothetical protein